MNDVYGRMITDAILPVQKTVLASSERTGVQLLDCGEDCQGRYEVITGNMLVACTDDYARARDYYFRETSRVTALYTRPLITCGSGKHRRQALSAIFSVNMPVSASRWIRRCSG